MTTSLAAAILERVAEEMRRGYEILLRVATDEAFRRLVDELYAQPEQARPAYVAEHILDPSARASAGVHIPDDVLVLRSSFGDRRPTLFCLKWYLPADLRRYWKNVNITFDNPTEPGTVPTDDRAWRKPLIPSVQAMLLEQEPNVRQHFS
ncbi:hypothetical protein ACWFRF_28875 [Nocardia sp. NPDC055165]